MASILQKPSKGGQITDLKLSTRRGAFHYVEQVLVPTLQSSDLVIMDNLGAHKGPAVRQDIEAASANLLFIPPYSSDLNPIERAFAKLQAMLRASKLRTVEALWKALGTFVDCFPPQECTNFLQHDGYFQST